MITSNKGKYPVVKCFTNEGLEEHINKGAQKALAAGQSEDVIEEFIEGIYADCFEVDLGAQGKIVIPRAILDHLNYPSEIDNSSALFVGYGKFFRIWHPDHFKEHSEEAKNAAGDSNAKSLANLFRMD